MTLIEKRYAMRHLLDKNRAADARAAYYAFDHAEFKTTLITHLPDTARAVGYVCLSRTGLDLFRPLVTMRLPWGNMASCTDLIYNAMPPGASVIMSVPEQYMPLIEALFEIETGQKTNFLVLDRGRYRPILNVLVTSEKGSNNLPRYIIQRDGEIAASASINWLSREFAEISVNTHPLHRQQGLGASVVSALCAYLIDNGRTPLYVVSAENKPSLQLAEQLGFIDSGHREYLVEGTLKTRPE